MLLTFDGLHEFCMSVRLLLVLLLPEKKYKDHVPLVMLWLAEEEERKGKRKEEERNGKIKRMNKGKLLNKYGYTCYIINKLLQKS